MSNPFRAPETPRAKLLAVPPSVPAVNTATRRVLAFAVGGLLLWLIIALQLFVNVDPLSVHRTDAVIMLGGAASERLPVARQVPGRIPRSGPGDLAHGHFRQP